MNLLKLISPDLFWGKALVTIKAIFDIIVLTAQNPSRQSLKFAMVILKIKPRFTMVRNKNLINLYNLVQKTNTIDLPGDIVECGVWNGGSAAMMGFACLDGEKPRARNMWLFDSFCGLPHPGAKDGNIEKDHYFKEWNKGDVEKVKQAFGKLGIPMDRVQIVPGWFESTLKTSAVDRIALLHIDADWYDSVKFVLEMLYDRVVPGGFVVLDDWGYWEGCNRALGDYISEHRLEGITLRQVGRAGAYFQKPV